MFKNKPTSEIIADFRRWFYLQNSHSKFCHEVSPLSDKSFYKMTDHPDNLL